MSKPRSGSQSSVAVVDRVDDARAGGATADEVEQDRSDAPMPGDDREPTGRDERGGDRDDEFGEDLDGGGTSPGTTQEGEIEHVAGYQPLTETARRLESDRPGAGERQPLDAWYASYADPSTIDRLAEQQQELTRAIIEVVIGADDRVRINPTTGYPWRCICSLDITAANGTSWIGTGWLVAPRTVITAGHCVWMHNQGGRVASIRVMPGRNGSATGSPFPSCAATHVRTTVKWIEDRDSDRDYGCIILPKSFMNYSSLGTFGYASLSNLSNLTVNLSGYPGDKPVGTQWFHSRTIKSVQSRRFSYDIDTAGGQSGAPVWRLKDGQRHAVGIHTNGHSTGNSAVRITSAVFDNIKAWKHWYD